MPMITPQTAATMPPKSRPQAKRAVAAGLPVTKSRAPTPKTGCRRMMKMAQE